MGSILATLLGSYREAWFGLQLSNDELAEIAAGGPKVAAVLGLNEEATRHRLIDADLVAAGWDVSTTCASTYADALEREHGQRPVIFYTNGPERTQPYRPAANRESTFSLLSGI